MKHILIGKVINAVKVAKDKGAIKFETDAGDIVALADGDCCSHSWIEGVELPVNGFPASVSAVSDIDMPDLGDGDAECIQYYGCKISTDKGDIVIDYRNESNGYYGGSLSWPDDEYFYGGVFGQNVSKQQWDDTE